MMKIQHVLSITLSLSLMACQVAAPLVSTPDTSTSRARTMVTLPAKTSLSVNHTAQLQSNGTTEQVCLQLNVPVNTPGFRTQLAQPDQLAFIKVTLIGEGISSPIRQNGDEFLPVTGGTLNATLSGIPTLDGKLRLVQVQGFNANKEPLAAFSASAWYRSQMGVSTVNLTLNRAQNLLYDILESLLLDRPAALVGLDIPALQTLLLTDVLQYNAQTGEFGQDVSLFDGVAMAALVTGGQALPEASALQSETVTLQNVSVDITTQAGFPSDEIIRFVLSDPLSKPLSRTAGSVNGSSISFDGIMPGTWLLSAYRADGSLLTSTRVTVSDPISIENNPLVLPFQGEFRVNTYTSNGQTEPSVASNAAGDFVVTWSSNSQVSNSDDIYGQRYNATGIAQGSEFLINTSTDQRQRTPSVAIDDEGDYVVVWASFAQDGDNYGIYGQRYNAAGVAQGTEFKVNAYTTGAQVDPVVAMDSDGDFVVTWASNVQDNGNTGVYAQRYNAAGVEQGSEFRVNTYTSSTQLAPAIAMDRDGDFVITWASGGQDGSGVGIYGQRYNATGVARGSEFQVNTYTTNNQAYTSVAMDSDGDFVVTWGSGSAQDGSTYGVYGQRYNAAGVAQGSEFQMNTSADLSQVNPSVAMDADGDFVATWMSYGQDGSRYGIYGQRYNARGVVQGTEFQVNAFTSGIQYLPSTAMDAAGGFVITWTSEAQDGSGFGVYGQRYTPTGLKK